MADSPGTIQQAPPFLFAYRLSSSSYQGLRCIVWSGSGQYGIENSDWASLHPQKIFGHLVFYRLGLTASLFGSIPISLSLCVCCSRMNARGSLQDIRSMSSSIYLLANSLCFARTLLHLLLDAKLKAESGRELCLCFEEHLLYASASMTSNPSLSQLSTTLVSSSGMGSLVQGRVCFLLALMMLDDCITADTLFSL